MAELVRACIRALDEHRRAWISGPPGADLEPLARQAAGEESVWVHASACVDGAALVDAIASASACDLRAPTARGVARWCAARGVARIVLANVRAPAAALELVDAICDLIPLIVIASSAVDRPFDVFAPSNAASADELDTAVGALSPPIRATLLTAAAFAGPFRRNELAEVHGVGDADVRDALHVLIRAHLVQIVPEGRTTRYRLFEPLRAHLGDRPAMPGDATARLAAWLGDRCEQAWRTLSERDSPQHDQFIDEHQADIAAVIHRASTGRLPPRAGGHPAIALCARERPLDDALVATAMATLKAEGPSEELAFLGLMQAWQIRSSVDTLECAEWAAEAARVFGELGMSTDALFAEGLAAGRRLSVRDSAEDRETLSRAIRVDHIFYSFFLRSLASSIPPEGDADASRRELVAWARTTNEPQIMASTLKAYGLNRLRALDLEGARAALDEAVALIGTRCVTRFEAHVTAARAALAATEGDLVRARAWYSAAVDALRAIGADHGRGPEEANLQLVRVELGEVLEPDAMTWEAVSTRYPHRRWAVTVALRASALNAHRPLPPTPTPSPPLDVLEGAWQAFARAIEAAQAASAAGRDDSAHVDDARLALEQFPSVPGAAPIAIQVKRLAARLLATHVAERNGWRIAEDGSGFMAPGAAWVDLSARRSLAKAVSRLLEGPCDREVFAASIWPGETIAPDALRNRVNVLVSTLRKAGFTAIQTRKDGWSLDPAVHVLVVPPRVA